MSAHSPSSADGRGLRLTEREKQKALADVRALRVELKQLQGQRAAQRTSRQQRKSS